MGEPITAVIVVVEMWLGFGGYLVLLDASRWFDGLAGSDPVSLVGDSDMPQRNAASRCVVSRRRSSHLTLVWLISAGDARQPYRLLGADACGEAALHYPSQLLGSRVLFRN